MTQKRWLKSGDAAGPIAMTRQQENSLKEFAALQKKVPFAPFATSDSRGWKGLQAVRYHTTPSREVTVTGTPTTHVLALTIRPSQMLDLRYGEVKRDRPLPPGSIAVVPAGTSVLWRREGSIDALLIYLEPSLVARVAAESFELDPSRAVVRSLAVLHSPELRSAMLAVDAELRTDWPGGPLLVESIATNLSVHLIRYFSAPYRLPASADGVLPRRKLDTVIEYIMENLEANPTLEQMAAVAHLSSYHFARQFKASTGLAPHQYVISRRIERAKHLLRAHGEIGLAEVALRVGFPDQSKFSFHFKRLVGLTPGQFRLSRTNRVKPQALPRNAETGGRE
jgi:AraC family transcriptional regulator